MIEFNKMHQKTQREYENVIFMTALNATLSLSLRDG